MEDQLIRTRMLYGDENMKRLSEAKVVIFGIGGVGGYAAEALARSGVGSLILVDHDTVALSNLNRQIIALHSTVGRFKVDVMAERIRDIRPETNVEVRRCFYLPQTADQFDFSRYSCIVDAVDTVTAKLEIIQRAKACGIPVISSMGAGNKTDPSMFRVSDIHNTSVCPLARVMRRECRKRGIRDLKVVYSLQEPVRPVSKEQKEPAAGQEGISNAQTGRRDTPGSTAFAPAAAGLLLASAVVEELITITHESCPETIRKKKEERECSN